MREKRRGLRALFAVVLMATVVVVASSDGEAQATGPECEQGVLVDGECRLEVGPAEINFVCPVSETVIADGDSCFQVVAAINGCDAGATLAGDECRVPIDLVPNGPSCFVELVNGVCAIVEDAFVDYVCEQGLVVDERCVVQGPAPINVEKCPQGFELVDADCLRTEDPLQVIGCTQGSLEGITCVIEGPPPVAVEECPVSATVFEDEAGCFMLLPAFDQEQPCEPPYQRDGGVCQDTPNGNSGCAAAPVAVTEVLDEIGETVVRCEYDVIVELACPEGATIVESGECRQPVALLPGPPVCDGDFELNGDRCLRIEASIIGRSCPDGELVDETCVISAGPPTDGPVCPDGFTVDAAAERCFIEVPAEVFVTCADGELDAVNRTCVINAENLSAGELECPVSETVVQQGDECFTLAAPVPVCPAGSTEDSASGQCLQLIAHTPGGQFCAVDLVLIDGTCFAVTSPVFRCGDRVTTVELDDTTCPVSASNVAGASADDAGVSAFASNPATSDSDADPEVELEEENPEGFDSASRSAVEALVGTECAATPATTGSLVILAAAHLAMAAGWATADVDADTAEAAQRGSRSKPRSLASWHC